MLPSKKIKDLTGLRSGKLTVVSYNGLNKNFQSLWNVRCDCGRERVMTATRAKTNKSCGCSINRTREHRKHEYTGMTKTRFHNIWNSMYMRCYMKSHPAYHRYAGKGITVCDEWKNSFAAFIKDMYKSYQEHCKLYGEKNTSIDRIDNKLGYYKENCRWATRKEQSNNMSTNLSNKIIIDIDGKEIPIKSFLEKYNISISNYNSRIKEGYSLKEIIDNRGLSSNFKMTAYREFLLENKNKLELLPLRVKKVIIDRYGIDDGKIKTLEEVKTHFDVSRERIRQIEAKGIAMFCSLVSGDN